MNTPHENQDEIRTEINLTDEQEKLLVQFKANLEKAIDDATRLTITNQDMDLAAKSSSFKHQLVVQSSSVTRIKSNIDDTYKIKGVEWRDPGVFTVSIERDASDSWITDKSFQKELKKALQLLEGESENPLLVRLTLAQRLSISRVFQKMIERIGCKLINPAEREYWLNEMMQRIRAILQESSYPQARRKAEERNRQLESMTLQKGDLVHASKGISDRLRHGILKNGLFAGEVLSGNLDNARYSEDGIASVETSFFLDFYEISDSHKDLERFALRLNVTNLPNRDNRSVAYIVRPSVVDLPEDERVTPFNFLLKPKGHLIYNFPQHPSEEHVSIYIGTPSTNICGIVLGGEIVQKWLDIVKKDLAENYWYISLFDTDMKPLFPYEEYLKLKKAKEQPKEDKKSFQFSPQEVDRVLENPNHTPEDIIVLFEQDFGKIFDEDAGVWERYSLRQHTLMVMNQFRKYFADKKLPGGVSSALFEIILCFHDIGKPKANKIKKRDKGLQGQFTQEMIRPVLLHMGFQEKEIVLAITLISDDPIGLFLQGRLSLENATEIIKNMACQSKMNPSEFLSLLLIYYQVDAASYTEDAGGKFSLDSLFVFDKVNKSLGFSPYVEEKFQQLVHGIEPIADR